MTATSGGFLAASECTKFVFGRGSAPDPAGRAYSAPPDPLAGLRGTLRGMGDEERGGDAPSNAKFLDPPLATSQRGDISRPADKAPFNDLGGDCR